MGRKLDPTIKVKRGPGRKARKQKGAETELTKFLVEGKAHILWAIWLLGYIFLFYVFIIYILIL